MAWRENGTLFVGTRFTINVYVVLDAGDHRETKLIAKALHRPKVVAHKDGQLNNLRSGTRVDMDGDMAAAGLSDADIGALAGYAASLS